MRTIINIIRQKYGDEQANVFNPFDIPYGNYFKIGFKLQLILAVQSEKELVFYYNLLNKIA